MKILSQIRRKESHSGFTMVEVVVSSVVFAIAAAGIYATVTSFNKPTLESSDETTAAFIAKKILDGWRSDVDASSWDQGSNPLTVKNWTQLSPIVEDGETFTPWVKVENDPDVPSGRKVTLNIIW